MRLKFFVYMLYSLIAVIFYSFVAHWVFDPSGWLYQMGARDFAGGAPVHLFGGINGLVATLFLGPRKGRYDGTRPSTRKGSLQAGSNGTKPSTSKGSLQAGRYNGTRPRTNKEMQEAGRN